MTNGKYLKLVLAVTAILLFLLVLSSITRSRAIAEEAFRTHCYEERSDYTSYRMVYNKSDLWGHYYDFSVPTPEGLRPGSMGFYRVYVTWIGTSSVSGFKGIPF